MRFLRTNTATIVTVGPFYDKTDGVTIKTGLTITNERISATVDLNDGSAPTLVLDNVTGATSGTANDLNYIANCDAGLMQLELAAANVNYVGRFFLTITDAANHVPVFHEFTILAANVYDALLGTDKLQVHADEITANLITAAAINDGAIDAATFAAGAINAAAIANDAIDLATFAADCKTGSALKANVETITNNAITAASINTGAITNAKFAAGAIDAAAIANGAIDNATFAADVGSTAYATNIIALAADKAILNYDAPTKTEMDTGLDAIPTAAEIKTAIEAGGGHLALILEDTGTTLPSTLSTIAGYIDTEVGTLGTELAKVPKSDSNVSWNATALAAINAEVDTALNTAIPGSPTADSINERVVAIDGFGAPPSAATVADAVWDEAATGHTDAGKAGQQIWTDVDAILADTGELQTNQGNWLTATGFSTHAAADVWTVGTRAITDKAGFTLSDAGVDAVWDRASSLTLSFETLLTRAYQMINNKMEVTDADGTVSLKNIGASGAIASGSVTDNSTTTTRLELTWA